MNKKEKNLIDDKEDLEIKKVASKKNNSDTRLLFIVLFALFCFTLMKSLHYINYYFRVKELNKNAEIIEISNKDAYASIINNGTIDKDIDADSFANTEEIVDEEINSIEVKKTKNSTSESGVIYDVKYIIENNDFSENFIATSNSELLVKFSYSYDLENWNYVNSVLTTSSSNISPLIGNTYDIAGLTTTLNVASNQELKLDNKDSNIIYWKAETIFRKVQNADTNKNLKCKFIINYKSSM